MIKSFLHKHKRSLISIAAIESVRGVFVAIGAMFLAEIVNDVFVGAANVTAVMSFFIAATAKIIIDNIRSKQFIKLSNTIQSNIRHQLHRAVFDHNATPVDNGTLLTLTFDAVKSIDQFITRVLPTITSLIILTPLILIVAAAIDPMSSLIFAVTLPIAPFLLYLIGKAIGERNQRAQSLLIKLNADFDELLRAVTTLKMFRQAQTAVDRLQSVSEKSAAAILDVLKLAFVSAFALELITTLAIALVAVTCGLRLTAGTIDFKAAFFILLLAPEFFAPIRNLGAAFHSFVDAKQALEKLKPFLETKKVPRGTVTQTQMPPSITLENVSFTYRNKLFPTIEHVNFTLAANAITVIKGESGAGKSTLLKLIAGINQPTVGEIFINDLPMSKMERQSIISKIAYVPQQPHYFDADFIDNAALFKSINPSTIKTVANEVGLNVEDHVLSRGQLQRLGLLRAILKLNTASILILDEPTAGLDAETEKIIIEIIKKYSRRRTTIVAAHRPAVIEIADRIIEISAPVTHRTDGNVGD